MKETTIFETPIGRIRLADEGGFLTECVSAEGEPLSLGEPSPFLSHAKAELLEYFRGERKEFDIPVLPKGTAFQKKVWAALTDIPYGETRSYADIAAAIGSEKAVRAVGGANHRNPILILIPCHRVIQKNGSLGGFACGLEKKRFLLELEQRQGENV